MMRTSVTSIRVRIIADGNAQRQLEEKKTSEKHTHTHTHDHTHNKMIRQLPQERCGCLKVRHKPPVDHDNHRKDDDPDMRFPDRSESMGHRPCVSHGQHSFHNP